jgi:penicillin amidase
MDRRVLAALLLAAVATACQPAATPVGTPIDAVVTSAGLGAGVNVIYDSLGVPHVSAKSDGDAAYALGYVHARDRLFQMDFLRRAARGTLSGLLGPGAVSQDASIRTIFTAQSPVPAGQPHAGSYRIEDVIASTLTPEFRAVLQRYADGVNSYLVDLSTGANGAVVPAEYVAIAGVIAGSYSPAPWVIEDTLAVIRLLTWELSASLDEEVQFGQFGQAFASACGSTPLTSCYDWALFTDLTRYAPAGGAFILPNAGVAGAQALAAGPAVAGHQALDALRAAVGLSSRRFGPEKAGSNNWVMGPTLAGNAVVANDPHLSLVNPSNFYLVQISTDTRNVGGVSFPGTPAVAIGHNDYVGWGDTVVGYDVTDVYYFPEGAGGAPVLPPGVVPVSISETISVRGSSTPVPLPITMIPGYGPVILHSGGMYYSARWTGQEASNEALAFYQLNAAKSVDEAFAAVTNFQVGAQNFVFADVSGNIGYYPHAYVPVRKAGCYGPRVVGGAPTQVVPWAPMPGFDGSCIWTGRIADAALPQAKNPPAHRIVTANNDITGVTAGNNPLSAGPDKYLYAYTDLGYRATRATQLLSAKTSGYTLDDMTATQADTYSLLAADVVPGLLAWFQLAAADVQAKGLGPAVDVLTHWSATSNALRYTTPTGLATSDPVGARSTDAEKVAASNGAMLFHALLPRLAARILDPSLAGVSLGGHPLDTRRFLDGPGGQEVAKYVAALAITAAGGTPAFPLYTGLAPCGGTPAKCASVAVAALDDTVKFLSTEAFASAVPTDWIWGRKHRVSFDSQLASAGVSLFNFGPFANDGGLYTVDVANFSWNDDGADGFFQHAGANVRFSAEMIAPGNVVWRAVLPGGQPGSVQNPNYQDQIPLWLTNAPGQQPWTAAELQAAAVTTLVFTPAQVSGAAATAAVAAP